MNDPLPEMIDWFFPMKILLDLQTNPAFGSIRASNRRKSCWILVNLISMGNWRWFLIYNNVRKSKNVRIYEVDTRRHNQWMMLLDRFTQNGTQFSTITWTTIHQCIVCLYVYLCLNSVSIVTRTELYNVHWMYSFG